MAIKNKCQVSLESENWILNSLDIKNKKALV